MLHAVPISSILAGLRLPPVLNPQLRRLQPPTPCYSHFLTKHSDLCHSFLFPQPTSIFNFLSSLPRQIHVHSLCSGQFDFFPLQYQLVPCMIHPDSYQRWETPIRSFQMKFKKQSPYRVGRAHLCVHLCPLCRIPVFQPHGLLVLGMFQVFCLTTSTSAAPLDSFLSSSLRLYLLKSVENSPQDFLLLKFLTAEGAGICRSRVWDRGLAPPGVCPISLIPPSSQSKLLQCCHNPHHTAGYYTIGTANPIDSCLGKHGGTLLKVRLMSAGMCRRSQHIPHSLLCLQCIVSQTLKSGYSLAPPISCCQPLPHIPGPIILCF